MGQNKTWKTEQNRIKKVRKKNKSQKSTKYCYKCRQHFDLKKSGRLSETAVGRAIG